MKYPCLVPLQYCKTDVIINIELEDTEIDGSPKKVTYEGKCNYQDSGKTIFTAEKRTVQVNGTVLIPKDIAPDIPNITKGNVIINGEKRDIASGNKCRNPDGTVNFTKIEVK